MKEAYEDFAKYCLLLLLLLPFLALAAEALGRVEGWMLNVAGVVVPASWMWAWAVGGFQPRPYVALLFCLAWLAWPVLLLMAKGFNPRLSWATLWLSVPLMSWYFVSMVVVFDSRGGSAARMGMFLGWAYMIGPFALLSLAFLTGRECVRIALVMWPFGKDRGRLSGEREG